MRVQPGRLWQQVVSESSLACHRSYVTDIASPVNFAAAVGALPVAGAAADRTVVQVVALLLTLIGLTLDFSTFAATQAVVAATSRSAFVQYAILYEVTTLSRRCSAAPAFSTIFVPIFVFPVDTFKLSWYWSLLVVAALSSVLLATFYVLEKSPLWLLEAQNTEKAERAVKAASFNAISPPKCRELFRKQLLSMVSMPQRENMQRARSLYRRTGIPVSSYIRVGIALVPMFLALFPLLQAGRFLEKAVVTSALVRATACAFPFLHFDELPFLGSVLVVIVRLSISVY
ncbi:hypothetical protein HPB48_015405 [Haemaphysalis longicornis]|uniref:Uncharacterized protein n=1 Tax=Haemaphysalis longicornis TaxID=44386 RepID=A0A9J6H3K8_HAELO|nr:hypothetical protein HPB48_015405 [Haemaphysalis longicornis]